MTGVIWRAFLLASILLWTAVAGAQRAVYKSVDDDGNISYSDRKNGNDDMRVRNWRPELSASAYDSAVLRAESDRLYYARLLAERRQPVPVVVYDPRGWQAALTRPAAPAYGMYGMPWRARARWDPNLPQTPMPSLDRNYYYNGR